MVIIYLFWFLGSVLGTIIFFFLGKAVLQISTHKLESQMRVQNQLLSLIAEKLEVPAEDIKHVISGNATVNL